MRIAVACFVVILAACQRPDPFCQGLCDAETEACVAQLGCAFLQNGNPSPFGEADNYSCVALPDRCHDDRTCACVVCSEGTSDDCLRPPTCGEAAEGGPLMFVNGCE